MAVVEQQDRSYVVVRIKDRLYALDATRVKEIAEPGHVLALPKLPPTISGVMRYRERVIPIIDLDLVLESLHEEQSQTANTEKQLIVLQEQQAMAGIIVDTVLEMESLENKIEPLPFADQKDAAQYCLGVIQGKFGVEIVLNIEHLFESLSIDRQVRSEMEAEDLDSRSDQRYSVFQMGDSFFCTPIEKIKRIVAADNIEKVEDMPALIRGVVYDIAEVPIVVIDCYQAFGIAEPELNSDEFFDVIERNVVLVEVEGRDVGFYVGPITEITAIPDQNVFVLSPVVRTRDNIFLQAIAIAGKELVNVVDLPAILELDEMQRLWDNT